MGSSISLFSGYDQKENRTTNYCLLVLKILYEESPKFLSEALSSMVDETLGASVGVQFLQQEMKKGVIPDGVIRQPSFSIFIETKNFNWFYDSQLESHLKALSQEKEDIKILIALTNFETAKGKGYREMQFAKIRRLCESKYKNRIVFADVSFEEFLASVKLPGLPKNIADIVSNFADYLNQCDLLASWQDWLDVINCAGIPEEILEGNVYMCPATGGAYNHDRCKYFGMYRNKRAELVALIRGVVDLESAKNATVKWNNTEGATPDDDLKALAHEKKALFRATRDYPLRVFILGELHETNFYKGSIGPMRGSKQYFNIAALKAADAEELASKLNSQSWPPDGIVIRPVN